MEPCRTLYHDEDINIHICNVSETSLHNHDFLELVYVTNGKAHHLLNNQKSTIQKGDFLILDYGAKHAYTQQGKEPFSVINCLFLPGFIDKTLTKCRNFSEVVNHYIIKCNRSIINYSPANYIFSDTTGSILSLLQKMMTEYEVKQSGYLELLRCHLIEIIIMTMRQNTAPKPISEDALCNYMIQYATEHLTDKNILGNISQSLNYSRSYCSQKFRSVMQISFTEFLQSVRINECCRLLANTDKKVAEIAELTGYGDIKFFNSLFKKHLGITPREFRKNLQA